MKKQIKGTLTFENLTEQIKGTLKHLKFWPDNSNTVVVLAEVSIQVDLIWIALQKTR